MSARASRRITIVGYYGFRNAGDEVILTAMLRELRRRPRVHITVASATPKETAELYGVDSFLWSDVRALMIAVEASDLVIVGGGGLFHDSFGFDPEAFLTDQQTGIAYYTAPVFLAALNRKPVMLYAVGAGPLLSEPGRLFTRIAGRLATAITVRDEASRDIFVELGISADKVMVTADPAFSFAAEVSAPLARPERKPVIAVSVRYWDRDVSPAFWERELAHALDLVVDKRDAEIVFIPFQQLEGQPEDDAVVAHRIRTLMRRAESAYISPHSLGPDEILAKFHAADAVLGMRLHSVILGLCAGRAVVALSYEPKVSQATASAGLADRTLDLRALDAARLAEMVDASLAGFPANIIPTLHKLAGDAASNATVALGLLDKAPGAKPSFAAAFELLPRIVRKRVEDAAALQAENRRCVADVATLMARVTELDAEILQRANAHQSLALSVEEKEREIRTLAAIRDNLTGDVAARDLALEELRIRHAQELDQLRSAHEAELEQSRADRNSEIIARTAVEASVAEAHATIQILRDESTRLLREFQAAEAHLAEAETRWARERESLQASGAALSKRLEEQIAENRRQATIARDDLAALRESRERVSRDLAAARAESVNAAGEWNQERQSLIQTGKDERARTRQVRSAVHALERQADELREAVLAGAKRYDRDFQEQLTTYRNQRAWQLMLLARKAYTLLNRDGWKGRLDCFSLALKTLARAPLELAPVDLTFPSALDYLPEKIFTARKPIELPAEEPSSEAEAPVENSPPKAGHEPRYDVVIFPVFDFEFRFQRPQQIAAELARRGHRVFWISPSRRLPEHGAEPFRIVTLRDNLHEVQLRRAAFDIYGGSIEEGGESPAVESLSVLYREQNIAESAVLLQFPFWRRFGRALQRDFGACLVYDQMDDWRNWPSEPRISKFNIDEEQLLERECDVLVVTSKEFAQRSQDRTLPPYLIPNAADFDFFHAAERLVPHPRPVVGYYGAIAAWFDLDLAVRLATARPEYDFVFIGGVHGRDVTALASLPNVTMPGEKHYRELPALLATFDVCLIPFALNVLTHAVDPVKVYEYLSQGKAVVATKMTELAPLAGVLYLADGHDDFLACVDRAVTERGRDDAAALRADRIVFAKRNTWAARVDVLNEAIDRTFPLVSIVILTHNSQDFIGLCCEFIRSNTAWPRYEVIVVDNASTDHTVPILRDLASADSRIRVIERSENSGFAAGNNYGVRESSGEFLVILNADTLPSRGWLYRLIEPLRKDAKLGMVAPVTNHSGNETRIDSSYRGPGEMEAFMEERARMFRGQQRELTMAPLLCVALRRDLWNEIGELDERFGVGMFEDDDYSRRVCNAGYRIVTAEDCFIHHFGSGSFSQLQPEQSLEIFAANRRLYEKKWSIVWEEHRMRENVRPLASALRLVPSDFRRLPGAKAGETTRLPSIVKLLPDITPAGQAMNRQPDGTAALVLDCARATPDTVVRWNDVLLRTSFGSPEFLSAIVPPELYASPGPARITLLNDFGISDAILFTVQ